MRSCGSPHDSALILEEPTAHLDPETAAELMRDAFESVSGRTILLSTDRWGLELVDEIVTLGAAR